VRSLDVSALILAGGKATRLGGIAKHELVVDGQTILERQLALLKPRVTEIIVSLPAGKAPSWEWTLESEPASVVASASAAGYRITRDLVRDAGPLGGMAAGLSECRTNWLLVVAGDMPHVTEDLLDQMLQVVEDAVQRESSMTEPLRFRLLGDALIGTSGATTDAERSLRGRLDAVGVRSGGLPEPLLCVLHKRVLPVVQSRLMTARYKASGLLTDEGLQVAWIDDADPTALRNVNSPEDL